MRLSKHAAERLHQRLPGVTAGQLLADAKPAGRRVLKKLHGYKRHQHRKSERFYLYAPAHCTIIVVENDCVVTIIVVDQLDKQHAEYKWRRLASG